MEENCLLVNLWEEHHLGWSEVTRLFTQRFAGRSKGALQPCVLEHNAQETAALFGGCRVENAIFINYAIPGLSHLKLPTISVLFQERW